MIDLSTNPEQGENFFSIGTVDVKSTVSGLKAGKEYHLEVRLSNAEFVARGCPQGQSQCISGCPPLEKIFKTYASQLNTM